jgi:PadR family transcriptional regulator PadR
MPGFGRGGCRGRGGGGRGRGRRGGGGQGMRRLLESVLLLRLHDGPAHGYSLLDGLDQFDLAHLDASVIYRLLRDMEGDGQVTSTWDGDQTQGPPRRIYRLTASGKEALAWWVKDLEASKARIERFLRAYRRKRGASEK